VVQGGTEAPVGDIELYSQGYLDWAINDYPPPDYNWNACASVDDDSSRIVGSIDGNTWNESGIMPGTARVQLWTLEAFGSKGTKVIDKKVTVAGDIPTKDSVQVQSISVEPTKSGPTGEFVLANPTGVGLQPTVRVTATDADTREQIFKQDMDVQINGTPNVGNPLTKTVQLPNIEAERGSTVTVCADVQSV